MTFVSVDFVTFKLRILMYSKYVDSVFNIIFLIIAFWVTTVMVIPILGVKSLSGS